MPRTAQQYVDLMAHKIGKTPDPRHDLWDTLNDAGRHLFLEAPFLWRGEPSRSIPAVAGQNYVLLPDDFHSIMHVTCTPTSLWPVQEVSLDFIMDMRRGATPLASVMGGMCISVQSYSTQATADSQPVERMELYPTPTADGNPTFLLSYKRTWRELAAADSSAVPNIPTEAENALVCLSRAMACARENEPDMAAGEFALYQQALTILLKSDAARQVQFGRIRGGANDLGGSSVLFSWSGSGF